MANTYLTRSKSSPTSDKIGTISFWVKRSKLTQEQSIINSGSGSIDSNIYFNGSNDKLHVYDYQSGAFSFEYITTRVFRDPSAWYAITVEIDTTLATASDRVKIYINGVRETVFDTSTTPSQNATPLFFTSANPFYIGAYRGTGGYFDGLLSHFHYTDGYAYGASTFGSTDNVTGEWSITTSPSITMGTNGFTILKDGNTITDQSANSNNFTLGGGTLTKTLDCPSNVFNTINILNPQAANMTIVNGNLSLTAQSDNGWRTTYGTLAAYSGKFYWEQKVTAASGSSHQIGITDQDENRSSNSNDFENANVSAYGYRGDGGKLTSVSGSTVLTASAGDSFTTNDIIGVAMDLINQKLYFSKNGTWQASGDPTSGSTGTGSFFNITAGKLYTPAAAMYNSGSGYQYNFGNGFFGTTAVTTNSGNGYAGADGKSIFTYQPPTGYSALTTLGLNQ